MQNELKQLQSELDSNEKDINWLQNKIAELETAQQQSKPRKHLPKTCQDLISTANSSLKSGMYFIDPDGENRGEPAFMVYCNMTTGKATSVYLGLGISLDLYSN